MGEFFKKCKSSLSKAAEYSFADNIANIVLLIVAALLLISLMLHPLVLVALALFGLFLWAILYC